MTSCRSVHGARASWSRCRRLPCMFSAPEKAAENWEKCLKVSEEPEQRRSADGWCRFGGGGVRPLELRLPLSHRPKWMKQRQQCACVRACVYTALKMQDGDLSGPVRSGTSVQAEECFTTLPDILESDPSTSASQKRLILLHNTQLYTEKIAKYINMD